MNIFGKKKNIKKGGKGFQERNEKKKKKKKTRDSIYINYNKLYDF